MSWYAHEAMARRPDTIDRDVYARRLRACFFCRYRRGDQCQPAAAAVEALAADPASRCPARKWGEQAPYAAPADETRIGVLMPGVYAGGVERWVESLARFSRHRWSVWSTCGGLPLDGVAIAGGRYDDWRSQQHALVIWGHRDEAAELLRGWSGPIIAVAHGANGWTRERMKGYVPYTRDYVAVSESSAAACRPKRTALVIRNGVDPSLIETSRTRDELRAEWHLGDRPTLLYCGRWGTEKRPSAAAQAVRHWPEALALCCVPTHHRDWAEHALQRLLPATHYRVVCDRAADAYRAADVLIQASPAEGGPLVVTEAWAAGLPVVSTDVGLVPEVRRDGWNVTVQIARGCDPATIATAARTAYRDRESLAAAGRAYTATWSAREMSAAWDAYLDERIAARATAAVG